MVNKKRLSSKDDFSDTYTCDLEFRINNSNGFLPPDSPEKLDSSHAAYDAAEETPSMLTKSRKKRKPSHASDSKRLWSKDDELVILKGIVEYRNETGVDYLSDSAAFFDHIKDAIDTKVSKDQLMSKIRKLKSKFRDNLAKKPSFTSSQDSETFDLSMAIWGKDKSGCVDGSNEKSKGTKSKVRDFEEQEVVTNVEPENDDESAKGDSFDKLLSENVDKTMEIETGGKESEVVEAVTNSEPGNHDGSAKKGDSCDDKSPSDTGDKHMEKANGKESEEDDAADELCALQDALETTLFQHLGKYAQKQMLQKLRSLRAKDRKELSGEWKSLLAQEALLKSKKYSFSAKLANATFHN
ncbi:GLABROUS1 enhancer-binding protein family [Arabidopsis suecica]|uniref:GLABROUS1 enhancer-binding protein family n=1 Tax=Arabidopsis suecica TaxID=45249 RepID=A0A8T2B6Z8_ARASU|nr:GLABROUS1 enhancer-binding protein family [Arabidopsis suecica]